jgi:hypothetical protein
MNQVDLFGVMSTPSGDLSPPVSARLYTSSAIDPLSCPDICVMTSIIVDCVSVSYVSYGTVWYGTYHTGLPDRNFKYGRCWDFLMSFHGNVSTALHT